MAAKVERILNAQPEILHDFDVSGFSFSGSGPNRGIAFIGLKPWSQRRGPQHSLDAVLQRVQMQFFGIPEAQIFAFNPPAIQGVGNFGGFQFELEDSGNVGLPTLMKTAYGYMALGNRNPDLSQVFTTFRIDAPQYQVHIDREKAKSIGVSLTDVFNTMQTDLGSFYVNNFDYLNRSYRVFVQAEDPYRNSLSALQYLYVRSQNGGMVPLSGLGTATMSKSAPIITHYNLFRSIEINGQTPPGKGSGQSIAAMEQLAQQIDPPGVTYEWSGLTLDEIEGGSLSALIFFIGIIFVFLVLAAQYESFVDPLIVLLAVPVAILGALAFLGVRGLPSDAYAQVGFVMLIGLASKSAILIVEFANQQTSRGRGRCNRRCARRADAAAADSHDLDRVHRRGDAAGFCERRRQRGAPFTWHGGIRRHDRLDALEPCHHAGALRDREVVVAAAPAPARNGRNGRPSATPARAANARIEPSPPVYSRTSQGFRAGEGYFCSTRTIKFNTSRCWRSIWFVRSFVLPRPWPWPRPSARHRLLLTLRGCSVRPCRARTPPSRMRRTRSGCR